MPKQIWKAGRMTIRDAIMAKALMQKYTTDAKTAERLRREYNDFTSLNPHLKTHKDRMSALMGQMFAAGLDPGSVRQYISVIDASFPFSVRAHEVVRAAEVLATDRGGRKHATDIGQDEADAFARTFQIQNDEKACESWIVYITGLRPVDVSRLWSDSLEVSKTEVIIRARWTKGIRKMKHRREVRYPRKELVGPPKLLATYLQKKHKRPTRFWPKCTASALNIRLKETAAKMKVDTISTGTFRRLYSDRIDSHCKATGIAKADMMLHICPSMDKAHYSFDRNVRKF